MQEQTLARMQKAQARIFKMAETDSQLAVLTPDPNVLEAAQAPGLAYREIIATVLKGYADRPALGTRAYELVTDAATGERTRRVLPSYATLTYGEIAEKIEAVANFWRRAPDHRVGPGDTVAFLAFNGLEMTAVDLACAYVDAVVVPLQANYPTRDLEQILADTAPVTLVSSIDNLQLAVDHALRQQSLRSVFVIGADPSVDAERRAIETARTQLADAGGRVALIAFAEALDEGSRSAFEPPPPPEGGRDRMVMIMYTSGSTGTPKGAIIHEAICVQAFTQPRSAAPSVHFIFAPMNHSLGRYTLYSTLAAGGTAFFTQKSDLSTLLEDLRLARPTSLLMIPRMLELAQQHYASEMSRRTNAGLDPETAHRAVRETMRRSFFGDRLSFASVGSAPTTPELRRFVSELFDIPVTDGYGNTESGGGGITIDQRLSKAVTDFKLIDVPELGYYASDKPYPRGELLIKTKNMIQGYFKRPEATAALFSPDGFLKTGDVMEQRGPDHLAWLDRRNNVIKLSQGEYVAIGPLETAYLGHGELIDQIYIYGNSQRAFLLAVVVPALDAARGRVGGEPSDEDLRRLVLQDMRETARKAELKAFEVPRDVVIEREPFSLHNGLLAAVGKPRRGALRARYDDALQAIYVEMDRKLAAERARLRGEDRSTLARVTDAIQLNLGLAELDPSTTETYTSLGGDSLGAVNMALLLEEIFEVPVPVTRILHPAATPARLAAQIDAQQAGDASGARYEAVHPDPDIVRADELTLDALLGEDVLKSAASAAPPTQTVRTVLLTGANGFLGRFLCLEWMEAMAAVDGKVICLVRGGDPDSARRRVLDAIGMADRELTDRFRALADHCLEVLPADLSAPRLGLDEETFARLAADVDQIVHVAALVNHRLSYRNLFEPNVLGTAELVRLALTTRLKRFDYVSTVAVTHLSPAMRQALEAADVRETLPVVQLAGDRYAMGYGVSKWAGEVILREAHEAAGLPVKVFRADMILPHARYAGQINASDSFTRLLASLIMTGVKPKSFYQLDPPGRRQSAHYDGMPVDFVAGAIQQIGARRDDGFHTYNLVNGHHEDGVSLDTIADWIAVAGRPLQTLDAHDQWFGRFKEKMENLPEAKRQASALSLIGRYARPSPPHSDAAPSTDFAMAVRGLPIGPDVPRLGEAYIRKCVRDMEVLGLVEAMALLPT